MSDNGNQLSNPFSTGGGGHNFENHVQSAFVVLMLTGGVAPCLPAWPIMTIKLQGNYEGYNTDDFIAFVAERNGLRKAKLLAQIKHSLTISENDETFAKVIRAAWLDFQNPECFDPKNDVIALITGPLSAHDIANARSILDWARTSAGAQEFFSKVERGRFSSAGKREKLQAFRSQLKKANKGADVENEKLWQFLKCYHVLGYDLDIRSGVTHSLINSHIAQFADIDIHGLWTTIAKEVESFNQNAGTITKDTLPESIRSAFSQRLRFETIPSEFLPQPKQPHVESSPDLNSEQEDSLMYASLLGAWNEKVDADRAIIRHLIDGHD